MWSPSMDFNAIKSSLYVLLKGKIMNKTPLIWRDQIVGYIKNINVDMFDVYGEWLPLDSNVTGEFLSLLQRGEQLWVQVGIDVATCRGTVELEPGKNIEIKLRPTSLE